MLGVRVIIREQLIDDVIAFLRIAACQKILKRVGRWQKPDNVEIGASKKRGIVQRRRLRHLVPFKIRIQNSIDRIGSASNSRRQLRSTWAQRWLVLPDCERESSLPRHALIDPIVERFNL